MRIVNVLALAACFFNIAFAMDKSAKDKIKKQKDTFDDPIHQTSSIDPRSSNWVPIILRKTGYEADIDNFNGYRGMDNGNDYRGMDNGNGYRGMDNDNGYRGMDNDNGYRGMDNDNGYRGMDNDNGYRGMVNDNGYRGMDKFKSYRGMDSDEPPMHHFPPTQKSQNQLYDPVGKAYVRVEMEHPIYTGRTFPATADVSTGGTSRPSSGIISVTSNSDRYTDGSYGNQGQGSVTPLALSTAYGSGGTAADGPITATVNNGYSNNPPNYPGYASSAYTDYASGGQSGVTSDYSNTPSVPSGYGPYESNYNHDVPSYYQTGLGPISSSAYGTGAPAYGPPGVSSGYTASPAPSSGYVGYGGTYHNYGQYMSYPVAYRGRLPQLFVVGAYGTPWSANHIEQETGYHLYR